jgi:D-alanine-D-alanine ligase
LPPADRTRPLGDGLVDVLIVRGARVDPIDGWGGEDVADQVLGVLRDAGLDGAIASVSSPRDVGELTAPRLVTLPSSRSFVDERGERHSLQRLLHRRGLPFVGSTAEGHAARSKSHMKRVLAEHGLPTPRWTLVEDLERIDVGLRFPLVVKPEGASESVGVSRVDDAQGLEATLRALALDGSLPALVEEWALQREFTVAVVGNGSERRGFPMEVMLPQGEQFLSADVKLHTLAQTPAAVADESVRHRLAELAIRTCDAFGILDMARVDILEDAAGRLVVIDVNTFPGLRQTTEHISYFPFCLRYGCGFDYAQSVLAIFAASLRRHGMQLPAAIADVSERLLADDRASA